MNAKLLQHQDALTTPDLVGYAEELGLDVDRLLDELRRREYAGRVAEDVASADASGVWNAELLHQREATEAPTTSTPTAAVRAARSRALAESGPAAGARARDLAPDRAHRSLGLDEPGSLIRCFSPFRRTAGDHPVRLAGAARRIGPWVGPPVTPDLGREVGRGTGVAVQRSYRDHSLRRYGSDVRVSVQST